MNFEIPQKDIVDSSFVLYTLETGKDNNLFFA